VATNLLPILYLPLRPDHPLASATVKNQTLTRDPLLLPSILPFLRLLGRIGSHETGTETVIEIEIATETEITIEGGVLATAPVHRLIATVNAAVHRHYGDRPRPIVHLRTLIKGREGMTEVLIDEGVALERIEGKGEKILVWTSSLPFLFFPVTIGYISVMYIFCKQNIISKLISQDVLFTCYCGLYF
jgi:hypothetical protein